MPTDLAAHAYGHALAVVGREDAAVAAAIAAVRRGGRARAAVLAHARHAALTSAAALDGPTGDDEPVEGADLVAVARRLAATRPARERAIADLETRHGLDRAGLGRVLGLTPSEAAARAAAVADAWERELDPALLAWLGPGDCAELGALLADRSLAAEPVVTADPVAEPAPPDRDHDSPPPSVGAALDAAPAIADHVAGCEVCSDRRRAMVSVRTLLAQEPLGVAPAAVRDAAAHARRRPAAPPPPLDPHRRPRLRRSAAAAAAMLVVVTAAALWWTRGDGDAGDRLDELTQVNEAGSVLVVAPTALDPSTTDLRIRNTSGRPITWQLAADADWLDVAPARGRLAGGESTVVSVRLRDQAPEGGLRATITVTGNDGSTAGATYETTLERPPDVSASAFECLVTATVEDDGHVRSVTLRWEGPVVGQRTMTAQDERWVAQLPSSDVALTWFVEAVDDRDNHARSPSEDLAAGACAG